MDGTVKYILNTKYMNQIVAISGYKIKRSIFGDKNNNLISKPKNESRM